MKKVLLTGASGFVGANLVRRLLKDGHEVHVLLRETAKTWRLKDVLSEVTSHKVALEDEQKLTSVVKQISPDWIFHTAVYGAYAAQDSFETALTTNIIGTHNLLKAAVKNGFEAFVNTGSSSEYGYKAHPPSEDEALEPNSYYAVTKATATHLAQLFATQHKAHIPTLRLYSVYGPYEEHTRLMPTIIRLAQEGALPPLVDPDIARDYVYIDDVVDAFIAAAETPSKKLGAIYNVGTGKQITLRQLVTVVKKHHHLSAEPKWGTFPNRSWDTTTWIANSEKISHELKWHPHFSVTTGVKTFSAWLAEHQDLYRIAPDNKALLQP